jgi:hypothetical protein
LAQLLLIAAEVPDLTTLRAAHLLPGVAAACAAIANAAQDCEDNQSRLVTGHEDLAPALFRLLTIDGGWVGCRHVQRRPHSNEGWGGRHSFAAVSALCLGAENVLM